MSKKRLFLFLGIGITLFLFVIPVSHHTSQNTDYYYPFVPFVFYVNYHYYERPIRPVSYPDDEKEVTNERHVEGHGIYFFGFENVLDKYYVYPDGHKERFQFLFYRFGPDEKQKKADKKELESLTSYLVERSGCEDLKASRKDFDRAGKRLVIDLTGALELAQVDNVACAMNSYITDNPDSFINREKPYILISFYDDRHGAGTFRRNLFAQIENTMNTEVIKEDTDHSTEISSIKVSFAPSFDASEFSRLNLPYRKITFSQAVSIDGIEILADMKDLKLIVFEEAVLPLNADNKPDFENLDYETYKKYCEIFNRINSKKGYKFADIHLNGNSEKKWRRDFKTDFVTVDFPNGLTEAFKLTIKDDFTVIRDDREGFNNLGWMIERNGRRVLHRNAQNELQLESSLQWIAGSTGSFKIYLTAWVDGGYVRVSNIIEYTREVDADNSNALEMKINGKIVPVIWENNRAVTELKFLSSKGKTIEMTMRKGRDQSGSLGDQLSGRDESISALPGDIVLFTKNTLVIFFEKGDGLYVKLGKIDLPEDEIRKLLSNGDVKVEIRYYR